MTTLNGKCLCGDVEFTTPMPSVIDACNCKICQGWGGGGAFIGADFFEGGVTITKDDGLTWYASSEWAKRGFCKNCGSSLFYRLNDNEGFWAISAGSLDLPEGLTLGKEIFIDEKPNYYALSGDHPRLTGEEFFVSLQGK
ncbi:MAG: GFA family protein [Hellea sp.]